MDGEAKISIAIVGIVPLPYHKSVENIFLHHWSLCMSCARCPLCLSGTKKTFEFFNQHIFMIYFR